MKSNYKLLIGVVAGVLVGAAGSNAIHGQEVKTPPVYLISEADAITDPTAIKEYGAKVNETLAPFNGHYHFVVRAVKQKAWTGTRRPKESWSSHSTAPSRHTRGTIRRPTKQSDRSGWLL